MKNEIYNKVTFLSLSIISIAILGSCTSKMEKMADFLNDKEAIYEDISVQMGTEYWNLYSDENTPDLETPKKRYADLFTNDTLNKLVYEWYEKRESINDLVLKRRIEIWHNILTAAKINYSENNLLIQNELELWLAEDDSVTGKPTQDELKSMLLNLIELRNDKAQSMGYTNYGELILEITEIGTDWFEMFVNTIDKQTLDPYKKLIYDYKIEANKSKIEIGDAMALVRHYYRYQVTPEVAPDSMFIIMKSMTDAIGIDYDNLPVRFVENQMPPGIGGQGIAVQIPNDFRIALLPGMDINTWMHELGHGFQAMHTSIQSPILKGYEWSLGSGSGSFMEGMAEVSGKFALNQNWVKHLSSISEDELIVKNNNINLYRPAYIRFWLSMIMFEVEFYKDITQDPDELKRKLAQKYLLLDVAPERVRPFVDMAIVSYPLYLQSYIIADIVAWQVHKTLEDKFGKNYVYNSDVSDFLITNFYKDGVLYEWQTQLQKATGRKLDINGYSQQR